VCFAIPSVAETRCARTGEHGRGRAHQGAVPPQAGPAQSGGPDEVPLAIVYSAGLPRGGGGGMPEAMLQAHEAALQGAVTEAEEEAGGMGLNGTSRLGKFNTTVLRPDPSLCELAADVRFLEAFNVTEGS